MKYLADFIKIVPLSDFQSFNGTEIITKSGSDPDLIPANNNLMLSDKPTTSRAGTIYDQSLTVVCDKLSTEMRTKYQNNMPVVIQLYTDDNDSRQWGDDAFKSRITITPGTDFDVLTLKRKSKKSVF